VELMPDRQNYSPEILDSELGLAAIVYNRTATVILNADRPQKDKPFYRSDKNVMFVANTVFGF
jgi:hypothetical protein